MKNVSRKPSSMIPALALIERNLKKRMTHNIIHNNASNGPKILP